MNVVGYIYKFALVLALALFLISFWILKLGAVLSFFVALNVAGFLLFGYDKSAAIRSRERVPEKTILYLAAIGATPLILLGMLVFRHKIRDRTFLPKLVILIFIQLVIAAAFSTDLNNFL